MIENIEFKNMPALLLENESIRAVIIPEIGGKLVSYILKSENFELLFQNKKSVYEKANLDSDFSKFDASGFDDCFPSIANEKIEYAGKTVMCPDHGEIWCSEFDYTIINDNEVKLFMKSRILPYTFEKTFSLNENNITIDYSIKNFGDSPLTGFYTVHLLMNCENNMQILMPSDVESIKNVMDSKTLGEEGSIHNYPVCKDIFGNDYRLDTVNSVESNKCEKYYAANAVKTGLCGVVYNDRDIKFTIKYDEKKLPYLGFWATEGGFRGDYNCALEPSSAFHDSVYKAKENNKITVIKEGESFDFSLSLSLKNNK